MNVVDLTVALLVLVHIGSRQADRPLGPYLA